MIYINRHEMMNIASVQAEYKQVDRYCTNSGCLKAGHQAESQARSMLLLLLLYYASTAVPGYR